MPQLTDVKETALYVDDMARAVAFYRDVMGLTPLVQEERFCALDVNGKHVLLLFVRGSSIQTAALPGGSIPSHDGRGPLHIGFSVDGAELARWEEHFNTQRVEILSHMNWPRGGRSVYFRDPDGHLLEFLTRGVWATY